MGETQTQLRPAASIKPPPLNPALSVTSSIPRPSKLPAPLSLDTFSSPVNQNGCFEFDRVLKSGHVQKRTTKTRTWKSVYLVLRPNTLFIYKSEKENKLRHKIYLSDLTAVAFLKDPKQKRKNVFGLFSPSKNFHLQTSNAQDCEEWVELIRKEARIEEEEEEMYLASPTIRRQSEMDSFFPNSLGSDAHKPPMDREAMMLSSSPEPADLLPTPFASPLRTSSQGIIDSGGWSGGEVASHSDFSDNDMPRPPRSTIDRLAVRPPPIRSAAPPIPALTTAATAHAPASRPGVAIRKDSQGGPLLDDPDRVVWQGRLSLLRSKGGVRQWKNCWAVVRPRNLILYKDESEYTALLIVPLYSIINVVDLDPISRTKKFCLQVITEEKSYRFAVREEESLLQCLGAFKSLLAKRKELEAKAVAAATVAAAGSGANGVAAPAALAAKS